MILSVLFNKYKVKPFVRDRQSQQLQTQKQTGTHRDKQIYKLAIREAQIQTHTTETEIDTEHEVKTMDKLNHSKGTCFSFLNAMPMLYQCLQVNH